MSLLNERIDKYDLALVALEKAIETVEAASPQPSSEQLLEVLLARDELDAARNNQSFPAQIAKVVIYLDERLKALSPFFFLDEKLAEWKESIKPLPHSWWWEFKKFGGLSPNKATGEVAPTIQSQQDVGVNPSEEQLLDVLQICEAVLGQVAQQNKVPGERVPFLAGSNSSLSPTLAYEGTIAELPKNVGIATANWRSAVTAELEQLFSQAVDGCEQALVELESAGRDRTSQQVIEVLLARDAVEKARTGQRQASVEKLAKLLELDKRLKALLPELAGDGAIEEWKKILLVPQNWWWEFKSALPDPKELPKGCRNWGLTVLSCACLGATASFLINTYSSFSQLVPEAKPDLAQNAVLALQLLGIGTGAAFMAKRGQERAALSFSVAMVGVAAGINASLPWCGSWYAGRGEDFMRQGEWLKAKESFLQAGKFINTLGTQAKIALNLGEVAEKLGDFDAAKAYYQKGQNFNDPAAMNALARVIVLQELPNSKSGAKIDKSSVREAEFLLTQALSSVTAPPRQKVVRPGEKVSTALLPNANLELQSKINTNYGILGWVKADLEHKLDPEALKQAQSYFRQGALQEVLLTTGKQPSSEELDKGDIGKGKARCFYRLAQLINLAFVEGTTADKLKQAETKVEGESCYNGTAPIEDLDKYDTSLVYFMSRLPGLPKNPVRNNQAEIQPMPLASALPLTTPAPPEELLGSKRADRSAENADLNLVQPPPPPTTKAE